jgi:hypothetical protein
MENLRYSNPVPPTKYKCKKCGVTGVKLWRDVFGTDLLCAKCATEIKGIPVTDIDENGERKLEHGQKTCQIGWYVPAVPLEDTPLDLYWADIPKAGYAWWRALSTTK